MEKKRSLIEEGGQKRVTFVIKEGVKLVIKFMNQSGFSLGCSLNLKNGLAREYSLTSLVLLTSSLTCLDSTKQFNLLLI